ncbi:MAG TPA: carboxylating nicotinate-nucleotide diphosphorylase [Firmicutes bacterium]|nr:carboxylating nicotinate-nucleotide diphosphorylase [Bacillota bacterium]
MKLLPFYIDDIIERALMEDINYTDAATDYLLDDGMQSKAMLISKDDGVLCGLDFGLRVFEKLDNHINIIKHKNDGGIISKGDLIAEISGSTTTLLKGERTALNIMQHMSGIATKTSRLVKLVEGTKASICDTRKTLPGLRALQKYAVVMGGGRNHRFNLSDAAMLKDNHIDAYGGIIPAVEALREKVGHMIKIEVETRNLDEVRQALKCGAEVIMLDNMDCAAMSEAVKLGAGKALFEASGNVTENNIRQVAETGVDIISVGALTHSVKAFDISMRISKD